MFARMKDAAEALGAGMWCRSFLQDPLCGLVRLGGVVVKAWDQLRRSSSRPVTRRVRDGQLDDRSAVRLITFRADNSLT